MGAVHKFDLTSDVTHLIVGETDTPKYKFVAKERSDVVCLLPAWMDAVRASWLEGGETDVEGLETKYKLPTFSGLRVCVTGFEDLAYRKELEDLVNDNGGDYRGNLTKDVTHLIAKVPSGNKYTYAGQWGVKIVAIEWLVQSVERGMILNEDLYNLLLPEEERGRNAWVRNTISTSSLGKRTRDSEAVQSVPRKLRRTASSKLSDESVSLWTSIVSGEAGPEKISVENWDGPQKSLMLREIDLNEGSIKAESRENAELEPQNVDYPKVDAKPLPIENLRNNGIFNGRRFVLHGFGETETSILQNHMLSRGADIVPDIAQLTLPSDSKTLGSCYIVVSYATCSNDIPMVPTATNQPTIVTNLWVEQCLFQKEFVEPYTNVMNTPISQHPISGFEKLTICSTAFQGMDLLHMTKGVTLMGATYAEYLTADASVLVCGVPSPSGERSQEKLRHALHWKIPTVTAEWLWCCIRTGELHQFDPYLIQACPTEPPSKNAGTSGKFDRSEAKRKCSEKPTSRNDKLRKTDRGHSIPEDKLGDAFSKEDPRKQAPSFSNDVFTTSTNNADNEILPPITIDLDNSSRTLREISLNPSPSPTKSPTVLSPKAASASSFHQPPDSLGPAISSLLAHHQRVTAAAPTVLPKIPRMGRRRRQLLGRAPSNISTHSNVSTGGGALSISRASSVDTMNTDGLGTPLEPCVSNKSKEAQSAFPTTLMRTYSSNNNPFSEPEPEQQPPPTTQLGYEDPDVAAWRERVVRKLGGASADGAPQGEKEKVREMRIATTLVRKGGVAGRTRQAQAAGRGR